MNARGLDILKSFESCRLRAYWDHGGKCWTCGWGSTGKDVGPTTVWTQAEADARRDDDIADVERRVKPLVKVSLNDDQLSALVDFAYNEGVGQLEHSTLLADVNAGDFDSASGEFGKWIYGGCHILEGLVGRRAAEKCLFESDYSGLASILDAR